MSTGKLVLFFWGIAVPVCLVVIILFASSDYCQYRLALADVQKGEYDQAVSTLNTMAGKRSLDSKCETLRSQCNLKLAEVHFGREQYNECLAYLSDIPASFLKENGKESLRLKAEIKRQELADRKSKLEAEQKEIAEMKKATQEEGKLRQEAERLSKVNETNIQNAEELKAAMKIVNGLKECGFLVRFDIDTGMAMVDTSVWKLFDVTKKETAAATLARVRKLSGGVERITILCNMTGKELASYSGLFGFKHK